MSCVDISSDGRVLVACTVSKVKIFYLNHKEDSKVKVSKFEAPRTMTERGARMVKFSPDGKWLLLIDFKNDVQLYRLVKIEESKKRPLFRPKAIPLRRFSRHPIQRKVQYGSLGNYERSINRVAFSADSRILVTGDLSGYLDSWVLEGHEDLTQEDDQNPEAAESSESSDGESVDEERNPNVILGQHWIRNPAALLIPKLPMTPLVLSFRPSRRNDAFKVTNGNTAIHPTRQNPHPHSHDLPDGEDRLLAFTSSHEMYEFEILKGRLSDWSRKNPSSNLPSKFRDIMEPAMGSIWDISGNKQRVWLYGTSWLWMFDLSKHILLSANSENQATNDKSPSTLNSSNKLKRKTISADPQPTEDTRKHGSGAGSKKPRHELEIGIGRNFLKGDGPGLGDSQWVNTDAEQNQASDDDDDDDDEPANESSMVSLPTGIRRMGQITNGLAKDGGRGDGETHPDGSEPQAGLPYWGTHQYRDILGIIPLGDGDGDGNEPERGTLHSSDYELARRLEVALVERPIWEVDLPPRYEGDQEWSRS